MIHALGEVHPAAVHFPIALLMTAGLAEFFYARSQNAAFEFCARFLLKIGAITAVLSAAVGFAAAASHPPFTGDLARNFILHRIGGISMPVLALLTWGLAQAAVRTGRPGQRGAYRFFLILTIAIVAAVGYLGGTL